MGMGFMVGVGDQTGGLLVDSCTVNEGGSDS